MLILWNRTRTISIKMTYSFRYAKLIRIPCHYDLYFAPTIYYTLCILLHLLFYLHLLSCTLNAILNSFQCHFPYSRIDFRNFDDLVSYYCFLFLYWTESHSGKFLILSNNNCDEFHSDWYYLSSFIEKHTHVFRVALSQIYFFFQNQSWLQESVDTRQKYYYDYYYYYHYCYRYPFVVYCGFLLLLAHYKWSCTIQSGFLMVLFVFYYLGF